MKNQKLQRLKEVLSIPTFSRNETLMINYLCGVLESKGYDFKKDKIGNIYVTKGKSNNYPCFVSHTDTVHTINMNLEIVEFESDGVKILTGIDSKTKKPSGIGGDDKCGVYLCLEMLDILENVKAVFFVSEEIGCVGSKQADPEFFKNVGYAIQFDSPKGNSMSMTLMGKELFKKESIFGEKVTPLILEHGIDSWERHPYTDIWPLMEKFNFACLNLAAGYHNYHTDNEYVVVEEVQNAFELGIKLHQILGENFYERLPKEDKDLLLEYEKKTPVISWDEDDYEDDYEDDDEYEDEDYYEDEDEYEDDDEYDYDYKYKKSYTTGEFEDFWNCVELNGGFFDKKN